MSMHLHRRSPPASPTSSTGSPPPPLRTLDSGAPAINTPPMTVESRIESSTAAPSAPSADDEGAASIAVDIHHSEGGSNRTTVPLPSSPSKERRSCMSPGTLKILLLIFMVLQNSGAVLVGRHTRTAKKDDLYVVNHLIVVTELCKLILALILEHLHTSGHLWRSIKENVIDRPIDALKIVIPSLLYLVQNSLLLLALSNLEAPVFHLMSQAKLLTTALVSVIMLNRKYSFKQWVCLGLLGIGVAIVVLSESSDHSGKDKEGDEASPALAPEAKRLSQDDEKSTQNLFVGLVAVSSACVCSALAGVYFEKVLKKPTTGTGGEARAPVSMWMRNVQMAFFSVGIGLVQYVNLHRGDGGQEKKAFMHGFTAWVWVLVALQAGGGLLVAAVIKYADNVLKGLATGVSVVLASICSVLLFGTTLSPQFTLGAAIILGSVFFFSNDVPGRGKKRLSDVDFEMKNLIPK